MKRTELLHRCEELIDSFDPSRTTVDAHATTTIGNGKSPDILFLKQVLSGCIRYQRMLKIFLSNFYHANSGCTSRNDYTRYMIISYLIFFRLKELGIRNLEGFVLTQDPTCMHILLVFIQNVDKMEAVKSEWINIVDDEFIKTKMFLPLQEMNSGMETLVQRLHTKAFGSVSRVEELGDDDKSAKKPRHHTVPHPPKLTKPKPRHIDEPMRIVQEIKSNPIPDFSQVSLKGLASQQVERTTKAHLETSAKYANVPDIQFQATRSNLEQVKTQVALERASQVNFDGFSAKSVPKYPTNGANVKLNVSAILREDALYKKKQEKEAQKILSYESELRDSTEFYKWQTSALKQDEETLLQQIEARRLEMVKTQHLAIEASLKAKEENRKVANEMKKTSKINEENRHFQQNERTLENTKIAVVRKQIREVAPRKAQAKLFAGNQEKRKVLNIELNLALERQAEKEAVQQAHREELIRQIRALDHGHTIHIAAFDPTSSSNVGLLEEMSLVELKERLQNERVKRAEEEVELRTKILKNKKVKQSTLKLRMENITRIRHAAANANQQARSRKKAAEVQDIQRVKAVREAGNKKLAVKLEKQRSSRKAEAERIAIEEELSEKKRKFMGAAKSMIEETHFEQLLLGSERKASEKQQAAQEAAQVYEKVQLTEKTMRDTRLHNERLAVLKFQTRKGQELEVARLETKNEIRIDAKSRKALVSTERDHYDMQTSLQRKRNPYATLQSDLSVQRGKTYTQGGGNNQSS